MPTWQWSYPYNDTDTHTVKFSAASADPTHQWRVPYRHARVPAVVTVETADRGVRAYEIGEAPRLYVLRWDGLREGSASSNTDLYGMLGIEAFLEAIGYGKNAFGLYDHAGSSELKVRYVSGVNTFIRLNGGFYSGEITLREEITA